MNQKKLMNDLEYVENQLSFMRQNPANDLQLITNILEIQYDILTVLVKQKDDFAVEAKCTAYMPNLYGDKKDWCYGIKHPEQCTCKGDKSNCNFY